MLPGDPAIVRPMPGGPQPHMIPIVPGVPELTGRTPLAERVERHMADKEDPHGTMVMVNEAIRGFIKNEADPLFSDWLAKHNVVEVETDPVFTAWVNRSNVRLGEGSSATSTTAIALGYNAKCSADGSVQLGNGTNLTRASLQFRNANLFVQGSGSVAALGTGFPRASASVYGAVKIGDGLKVVDGVVSSDVPDTISDSAGNVIRADGSSVVIDGSWTCNGVVLTKAADRDDYWENAERHWGLGYNKNSSWLFADGSGFASTTAPADATKLSFVIGEVTYESTIGRADSVVMAGDVVPKGSGTETIATIGGKDIKAPASPVSSVNGKTGAVTLGAKDVGALALESANKVGSSFSMDSEGEETSGGNLSFGVGMGPAGRTFIANKFYCQDRLYANGFVITNTSGAPGESVLDRIQEYGGDYKTALDEVNGIVGATAAYPMATVVDGALKDRTVNHATAGGTFTFPARTDTNARDFVLVIDALETAPTVTFPGSFTYVSEQDAADIWTAEAGKVNAWYFSEVADGVFMVCHKAMSVVAQ